MWLVQRILIDLQVAVFVEHQRDLNVFDVFKSNYYKTPVGL